eukprot:COSAG02_NODE_169_length_31557_cov_25.092473_22_plen_44_part_00
MIWRSNDSDSIEVGAIILVQHTISFCNPVARGHFAMIAVGVVF